MDRKLSNQIAKDDLVRTMQRLGYSAEFAYMISEELDTEWACSRMKSYIVQARPEHLEDIADELVAICEARAKYKNKAISEHANASYTAWLNSDARELN